MSVKNNVIKWVSNLAMALVIIFVALNVVAAQTAETSPTPQATATPLPTPAPKSTPLPGSVEGADKMQIEAKIQTYRALRQVTDNIAHEIYGAAKNAKVFVLYRPEDYVLWQNYKLKSDKLLDNLNQIKCGYDIWTYYATKAFTGEEPNGKPYEDCSDTKYKQIVGQMPAVRTLLNNKTPTESALEENQKLKNEISSLENQIERLNSTSDTNNFSKNNSQFRPVRSRLRSQNKSLRVSQIAPNTTFTASIVEQNASNTTRDLTDVEQPKSNKSNIPNAAFGLFNSISTPIGAATTAVGALVDLIGFFRSDTAFSSPDINVKPSALRSSVAVSLRSKYCKPDESASVPQRNIKTCPKIYDMGLFTPFDLPAPSSGATDKSNEPKPQINFSPLSTRLTEISKDREKARILIAGYEAHAAQIKEKTLAVNRAKEALEKANAAVKDYTGMLVGLVEQTKDNKNNPEVLKSARDAIEARLSESLTTRQKIAAKIDELNQELEKEDKMFAPELGFMIENLKALNTMYDAFASDFNKIDPTTGFSPSMVYEKAYQIDKRMSDDDSYWLDVNSVEAGGNTRVIKNLFRYFYRPNISYNGGSIIEFNLGNQTGEIILSNTNDHLMPYQKAKKLETK